MTSSIALFTVLMLAGAIDAKPAPAAPAAIHVIPAPRPAPTCWTMDVKRCCKAAGIPAAAQCNKDGVSWTCPPSIILDPLIVTYKLSETGFEGKQDNGTEICKYTKRNCGSSVLTCTNDVTVDLECQAEKAVGQLCESDN